MFVTTILPLSTRHYHDVMVRGSQNVDSFAEHLGQNQEVLSNVQTRMPCEIVDLRKRLKSSSSKWCRFCGCDSLRVPQGSIGHQLERIDSTRVADG